MFVIGSANVFQSSQLPYTISLDYSGKGTKSFDTLTGDQELEVRTATYGPEIDQS